MKEKTGRPYSKDEIIGVTEEDIDVRNLRVGRYVETILVNNFQFPDPVDEWRPSKVVPGAYLGAGETDKKCFLPLSFLKIGDVILKYRLVGDITEVDAVTLNCKLMRMNKADPITKTNITNGAISTITINGVFDAEANNNDETVATDKQYLLEIEATTGTGDYIRVMGAEVVVRRKQ